MLIETAAKFAREAHAALTARMHGGHSQSLNQLLKGVLVMLLALEVLLLRLRLHMTGVSSTLCALKICFRPAIACASRGG
jgi:hypothetical protein